MSQTVENCPISQCWRILQKKDPDPEAEDFKIQSVLFPRSSCQNFHEDPISSFYVRLLTDKQTDKQTDRQTNTSKT